MLLYRLLGDERLLSSTPYYDGDGREGDTIVALTEYHCPPDAVEMLRAPGTREVRECASKAHGMELNTYIAPEYALGTMTRPYGVGEPPEPWPGHERLHPLLHQADGAGLRRALHPLPRERPPGGRRRVSVQRRERRPLGGGRVPHRAARRRCHRRVRTAAARSRRQCTACAWEIPAHSAPAMAARSRPVHDHSTAIASSLLPAKPSSSRTATC